MTLNQHSPQPSSTKVEVHCVEAGKLSNKVALITGGANGIGLGTAHRFCQEGADICIIDLEEDALKSAARELEAYGTRVLTISTDCLEINNIENSIEQTIHELGHIDILVNNIGQSARERASSFLESKEEVWRFVFDINVFTMMRFTRLVAPAMVERNHGRIINLTSDSVFLAPPNSADYIASKAAVIGFTRALSRELGSANITVNCVGPGPIKTRALERASQEAVEQMIDNLSTNFIGEPSDIAAMIAHLASEEGRYITGQTILVNGGGCWV